MPRTEDIEEIVELSFEQEPLLERYSARHEFPISLVGAALILLLAFGMIYVVMTLIDQSVVDRKPVPISLVQTGDDDAGDGKAGGAGDPDPGAVASLEPPTAADIALLPEKIPLPDVKIEMQKVIQIDPNGTTYISDEKAAAFGTLSDEIRKKLLNQGGSGNTGPKGTNGNEPGDGKGGIGANSTNARSIRWVIRFRTETGRDYLNQLGAMNALVFVPLITDDKKGYLFRDLKGSKPGELVDANGLDNVAGLIKFCDIKRQSVQEVALGLNLGFVPNSFWAFFPRSLETDLARKEEAYIGRRAEDIAETVFQVVMREGKAELIVVSQKPKK